MIKYTYRLYGFANWKQHLLYHKLIIAGNKFSGYMKYRKFRFVRSEVRNAAGNVESFSTVFQMKKSPFHVHWHDLDLNVDGHIQLALRPLTFSNVFGGGIDLTTLNYVAPGLKPTISKKDPLYEMAMGVEAAAPRIRDILGAVRGQQIIDSLNDEITLQREDRQIPFSWNLDMYRNPPINWDPAIPFVSQTQAHMDAVREEAERQVHQEDAGGPINRDLKLTNIGDYVIVGSNLSSDRLKRPFWVGQVTATYPNQGKLRVHWLLPPTTHSGRGGKGTKGNGEEAVALNDESAVNRPAGDKLSYVTPLHPPKDRKHMPQEPNKQCVLRHYPYAQFKAVMDLNSNNKSHSNKGIRKPIIPSFVIPS
jgi:hypothetical protein